MKFIVLFLAAACLTACNYTEVKREIGYKGKARINPWLAAERFAEKSEYEVRSLASWATPDFADTVWFVPASVLSNLSFTRRMEDWVEDGGHLVLLVEHAESETNDWSRSSTEPTIEPVLIEMLARAGIELKPSEESGSLIKASSIEFDGKTYAVDTKSSSSVALEGEEPGVFASVKSLDGRITVLTDARIFRNRWIGDKQHAELLEALMQSTEYEGPVAFLRGSGLSLWELLGKHLWPVLVALGCLIGLWLWKNLTRFGPVEAAEGVSTLRGYEHHLEALGDFQWRLDRATGLLAPLRSQIIERGQRISVRAGKRDDDFFQFLADRADLPRERVFRALAEAAPADTFTLTRTTADLQKLLQVLH